MTARTCARVIKVNREKLTEEEWLDYAEEMADKLDVFFLGNRITKEEYDELLESLK